MTLLVVANTFLGTIPLILAILCVPVGVGLGKWGLTLSNQIISAFQRASTMDTSGCCILYGQSEVGVLSCVFLDSLCGILGC